MGGTVGSPDIPGFITVVGSPSLEEMLTMASETLFTFQVTGMDTSTLECRAVSSQMVAQTAVNSPGKKASEPDRYAKLATGVVRVVKTNVHYSWTWKEVGGIKALAATSPPRPPSK